MILEANENYYLFYSTVDNAPHSSVTPYSIVCADFFGGEGGLARRGLEEYRGNWVFLG